MHKDFELCFDLSKKLKFLSKRHPHNEVILDAYRFSWSILAQFYSARGDLDRPVFPGMSANSEVTTEPDSEQENSKFKALSANQLESHLGFLAMLAEITSKNRNDARARHILTRYAEVLAVQNAESDSDRSLRALDIWFEAAPALGLPDLALEPFVFASIIWWSVNKETRPEHAKAVLKRACDACVRRDNVWEDAWNRFEKQHA